MTRSYGVRLSMALSLVARRFGISISNQMSPRIFASWRTDDLTARRAVATTYLIEK